MIYKNPTKLLSLICTTLITVNVHAQSTTRYFEKFPEINPKVEAFTNAFVKTLLPEIQQSQVRFDFSMENGVSRSDLAYGQIAGTFSGLAVVQDSKEQAAIDMNFRFYFEIVNPPNRPQKYGMNFKADGVVENSAAFTDFFLGILIPKCQEQDVSTMNKILKNACQALSASTSDSNKSDIQMGFDLLTEWKQQLLEGITAVQNSKLDPIKSDFLKYIDERIQISNVNNQLNLSINMSDLVQIFDEKGRSFLFETELLDYSLQNLNVQMNSQKIDFSVHVQKLHAVKDSTTSVNNLMTVASGYNEVFQNPDTGALIGEAIRNGNALIDSIKSNASTLDNLSGNLTGIWGSVFGSANDDVPATTDRQSDLGLD